MNESTTYYSHQNQPQWKAEPRKRSEHLQGRTGPKLKVIRVLS